MSRVWLEAFLGRIGEYIIYYVTQYYIYVIPIIVIYGIFLTLSSYNFKRIEKRVNAEIVRQSEDILNNNPHVSYVTLLEKINIDWEKIIASHSYFPFIAREADFWVKKVYPDTVRKFILDNNVRIKTVLQRSGIYFGEEGKGIRKNFYLDNVHRLTKRDN